MRKFLWYWIAIIALLVVVILEIVGVFSLKQQPSVVSQAQVEPSTPDTSEQAIKFEPIPNLVPEEIQPAVAVENIPAVSPDSSATQVYDVVTNYIVPGEPNTQSSWVETWAVSRMGVKNSKPDEFDINIRITSDRSDDVPTDNLYRVYKDGTIKTISVNGKSGNSIIKCDMDLPVYLPVGVDTAPAFMNCFLDGKRVFNFTGTATAESPTTYSGLDGAQIKNARTVIISDDSTEVYRTIFSPEFGMLEFSGTLGNLIIGETESGSSVDSSGIIKSTTSDNIWEF